MRRPSSPGEPTVIGAEYGSGTLAVVNDDIGQPLYLGFSGSIRSENNRMFRAWFDDVYNAKVKSVYEEARRR